MQHCWAGPILARHVLHCCLHVMCFSGHRESEATHKLHVLDGHTLQTFACAISRVCQSHRVKSWQDPSARQQSQAGIETPQQADSTPCRARNYTWQTLCKSAAHWASHKTYAPSGAFWALQDRKQSISYKQQSTLHLQLQQEDSSTVQQS